MISDRAVLCNMNSREFRTEGQNTMSNEPKDVQFGDPELMVSSKEEIAMLQAEHPCDCDSCEDELCSKLWDIEM
jgi:hypothetical protein